MGGLSTLLVGACTRQSDHAEPAPTYPDPTEAATGLGGVATDFGERLLGKLMAGDANKTVLISPLSALLLLMVLGLGARGETASAIASGLGFSAKGLTLADAADAYSNIRVRLTPSPDASVGLANGIWVDAREALIPTFAARQTADFGIRIAKADLSTADASADINRFVNAATYGKIPSVVDQLPANASLVLVNALYFKGGWFKTFDAANTRPGPFHRADGASVAAEFMQDSGDYAYVETADLQSVRLYYADPRFELILILTKPGAPPARWSKALSLDTSSSTGQVILPRLNLTLNQDLKKALGGMGFGPALSSDADYGAMISRPMKVIDVVHSTKMQVDEQGVEASAATEFADAAAALPQPTRPFVFRADRPFHLVLRESGTRMPLFMAYVSAPTG
jgi:serpin B